MENPMRRALAMAAIAALTLAFLLFMWPGLYRYHSFGDGGLARTNRLTGETRVFDGSAWTTIGERNTPTLVPLDSTERSLLTGYGEFKAPSHLELSLYNGSQRTVRSLEVEVSSAAPLESGDEYAKFRRCGFLPHVFRTPTDMQPLSASTITFDVGVSLEGCRASWKIQVALAHR